MNKVEILKQKDNYFLWIDDYLWMWDIPYEVDLQKKLAENASGNVLVVGYGLGIIQKFLAESEKVTKVTTVELIPEIIDECKKTFGKINGNVVISDFFKFNTDEKFDFVIGDIWPDISPACLKDYVKFVEQGKKFLKKDGNILAWGQEYFEFLLENQEYYYEKIGEYRDRF